MASAPLPAQSEDEAAQMAAAAQKRPVAPSRAYVVPEGRLPVSEFASDRPGANSPFGDDLTFPLPVNRLTYTHASEGTIPSDH